MEVEEEEEGRCGRVEGRRHIKSLQVVTLFNSVCVHACVLC